MPPPGGAGGASVGFIKEKPDPWEVIIFNSYIYFSNAMDRNCEA